MEGPTEGGTAFMRNVGRLLALYIRTHPEMVAAMEQRSHFERCYLRAHRDGSECTCVVHGMRYCAQCHTFNSMPLRYYCSVCNQTFCKGTCAKKGTLCSNQCCFTCYGCHEKRYRGEKCWAPECTASVCARRNLLTCATCQRRVCDGHKRFCGYCATPLCGECADNIGHVDCERRKRFKPTGGE
jgi:hypothetical protein